MFWCILRILQLGERWQEDREATVKLSQSTVARGEGSALSFRQSVCSPPQHGRTGSMFCNRTRPPLPPLSTENLERSHEPRIRELFFINTSSRFSDLYPVSCSSNFKKPASYCQLAASTPDPAGLCAFAEPWKEERNHSSQPFLKGCQKLLD